VTTTLIVWGASSGAGKSLLATALCRWAARQGMAVRPFKAQNMSNNARVVQGLGGELGEIGSAQYFQALAARAVPHVDMNPVLLKPERDTASQVLVQGRVVPELGRQPWRERSAVLAEAARQSFDRLWDGLSNGSAGVPGHGRGEAPGLIVVEGAGSPAEINLAAEDYVNLGVARWAQARGRCRALLVSDIDRGGSFAHLYGTWALLPADLQPLLAGFVLNKFRGDPALLAPGPQQLQGLTGVPLLGVLPMVRDHGLPEEDGQSGPARVMPTGLTVAIVATPHISNLDEFQPLQAAAAVRWVRRADEVDGADWVVLPGSKQVSGDLAWLRAQGLDAAIVRHAQAGRPLLGVCGGLQMLGQQLADPDGVDGEPFAQRDGLGLLPLATRYGAPKRLRAEPVRFAANWPGEGAVPGLQGGHSPWRALAGLRWSAYEIRCGRTEAVGASTAAPVLWDAQGQPIGWCGGPSGNVLGIATHGLFETAAALRALCGRQVRTLDDSLDGLADLVEEHLGAAPLRALIRC
jgi:adenosylcobyric acid synthase